MTQTLHIILRAPWRTASNNAYDTKMVTAPIYYGGQLMVRCTD